MCVIQAHVEMMDRIEAGELEATAVAGGVARSFKRGRWAGRQLSTWRRIAASGGGVKRDATGADLRAAGIGKRIVKRVKRGD